MRNPLVSSLLCCLIAAPAFAAEPAGKPGARKMKETIQQETESRSCKERGGEWRCTTGSTGKTSCACSVSSKPK